MPGSKLRKTDYVRALQAALICDVEKYDEYLVLLDNMESNANNNYTNVDGDDINDTRVATNDNGTTGVL